MAIVRVEHNKENPYFMLNRTILNDPNLSFKAKGLHAYLLSKPDDWNIHIEQLAKVSKEGIEAVKSGLIELKKNGYVELRSIRNEQGNKFLHHEYVVYEVPKKKEPTSEPPVKNSRKASNSGISTTSGFHTSGFYPSVEQPSIQNNDNTQSNDTHIAPAISEVQTALPTTEKACDVSLLNQAKDCPSNPAELVSIINRKQCPLTEQEIEIAIQRAVYLEKKGKVDSAVRLLLSGKAFIDGRCAVLVDKQFEAWLQRQLSPVSKTDSISAANRDSTARKEAFAYANQILHFQ